METPALIGPSIRIKGEVHSGEPLVVAGHVDGSIEVSGHPLTIDAGGSIDAMVTAHTIVVSGQANGTLTATGRVVVNDTAKIVGDISAPVISLAEGALVNGRIETGEKKKAALSLVS